MFNLDISLAKRCGEKIPIKKIITTIVKNVLLCSILSLPYKNYFHLKSGVHQRLIKTFAAGPAPVFNKVLPFLMNKGNNTTDFTDVDGLHDYQESF